MSSFLVESILKIVSPLKVNVSKDPVSVHCKDCGGRAWDQTKKNLFPLMHAKEQLMSAVKSVPGGRLATGFCSGGSLSTRLFFGATLFFVVNAHLPGQWARCAWSSGERRGSRSSVPPFARLPKWPGDRLGCRHSVSKRYLRESENESGADRGRHRKSLRDMLTVTAPERKKRR